MWIVGKRGLCTPLLDGSCGLSTFTCPAGARRSVWGSGTSCEDCQVSRGRGTKSLVYRPAPVIGGHLSQSVKSPASYSSQSAGYCECARCSLANGSHGNALSSGRNPSRVPVETLLEAFMVHGS